MVKMGPIPKRIPRSHDTTGCLKVTKIGRAKLSTPRPSIPAAKHVKVTSGMSRVDLLVGGDTVSKRPLRVVHTVAATSVRQKQVDTKALVAGSRRYVGKRNAQVASTTLKRSKLSLCKESVR
jgi:hypothetical protein